METNFGASAPYTVGIEEEFGLVDPDTLDLTPAISGVLAGRDGATGFPPGSDVASELIASCIEARSPVYDSVSDLAADLPRLRRAVGALVEGRGSRLLAAGTHPFGDATEQPVTDEERYREVEGEMGWTARTQSIYGLHVHVAVPDPEHAIRATNNLARHSPLFLALSANSPYWRGRDTRLSSVRVKVFELVPRSGLPPAFHSWQDFEHYVETLVRAGSIPDYTWCWWDARPHPRLGTVELRAPDAQTDPARTSSLAALAQCLVVTAADDARPPENPLFVDENKWRAARHGLDARLYDFNTGETTPAREAARALVRDLSPTARNLGCEAELEGVLDILETGNGASMQRAVFEKSGSTRDVAAFLVSGTV